jgi:hypothetical protein
MNIGNTDINGDAVNDKLSYRNSTYLLIQHALIQ